MLLFAWQQPLDITLSIHLWAPRQLSPRHHTRARLARCSGSRRAGSCRETERERLRERWSPRARARPRDPLQTTHPGALSRFPGSRLVLRVVLLLAEPQLNKHRCAICHMVAPESQRARRVSRAACCWSPWGCAGTRRPRRSGRKPP